MPQQGHVVFETNLYQEYKWILPNEDTIRTSCANKEEFMRLLVFTHVISPMDY